MLTEKQQELFVTWYKDRYGDTSETTGTGEIPKIPEEEMEEDIKAWIDFLKQLLGKNAKKIYTHRGGRKEDYLHVVFNGLFLGYGPTYVDKDGNVSEKHMRIDDVLKS